MERGTAIIVAAIIMAGASALQVVIDYEMADYNRFKGILFYGMGFIAFLAFTFIIAEASGLKWDENSQK